MQWLAALNDNNLNKLTYDNIKKENLVVCYKHFPANAILEINGRPSLKQGFLPNQIVPCNQESVDVNPG